MKIDQNSTLEDLAKYLYGNKNVEDIAVLKKQKSDNDMDNMAKDKNEEDAPSQSQNIIIQLAQKVNQHEEEVQRSVQKIEELDASVRSLRNALHEMKSEASQPSSRVAEMISEQDARFEEKISKLEEKLEKIEAQRVSEENPPSLDDEFENLDTAKEVQNDDEFEPLRADEEEVVDDTKYGTYPPDDIADTVDDEQKPKKKGSVLKKILIFVLLGIVTVAALIAYIKIKQQSTTSSMFSSNMIDPMAAQSAQPMPSTQTTVASMPNMKNTIDPLAAKTEKQKAKKRKTTVSASKLTAVSEQARQVAVSSHSSVIPTEIDPLDDSSEKSPIEDELLQNHKQVKDIAFRCRLKAKYPAGEYIYYNKQGGKYAVNPKEDAVFIGEKNVIYNYSPENKFVKVGNNKYLKTKLFANCKAIVPSR